MHSLRPHHHSLKFRTWAPPLLGSCFRLCHVFVYATTANGVCLHLLALLLHSVAVLPGVVYTIGCYCSCIWSTVSTTCMCTVLHSLSAEGIKVLVGFFESENSSLCLMPTVVLKPTKLTFGPDFCFLAMRISLFTLFILNVFGEQVINTMVTTIVCLIFCC